MTVDGYAEGDTTSHPRHRPWIIVVDADAGWRSRSLAIDEMRRAPTEGPYRQCFRRVGVWNAADPDQVGDARRHYQLDASVTTEFRPSLRVLLN